MAAPIRLADPDMEWLREEQYRRAGASPTKKGPPFHEIVAEALVLMRSRSTLFNRIANEPVVSQQVPHKNASAHALIDELIERRPETAENVLATIRAFLREEPVPAKVVPAQTKSRPASKGARASG